MLPDLARLLARPIAHRGLHACGRPGPVENSIEAALAAVASGYGIECDVQLSRDGEAIVFHDADLARLTGASGRVGDLDAASLRRLRLTGSDNDHVPCLAELLRAIGARVPLVIEIKSDGNCDLLTDRTLSVIADYPGVVAIESFDPGVIRRCRASGTSRPVGLVGPPDAPAAIDPEAVAASDFLSWSIRDLPEAAWLFPGMALTSWTVRTPADEARARHLGAQIVFEGFTPLLSVNDAEKEGRGLSL